MPTIISDGGSAVSIEVIRSYFTDEQVVRGIANHIGIDFDDLTNGDYKLMIEPIMYITYNGIRTAMTATEAALYNMQTGGDLINKMGPLSHKNLPLAMFLEKDDLGYTAWTGSKNSYMTDSDIIQYLGVGIVSFKEPEEEVEVTSSDYEYRVDTDVYTSIIVALFEFAIESQNGRGDPKALALNIIKGFFAVNLFCNVPVQLYGLAVSLQSSMSADMTGV